jgi:uncharacterized protein (DUF2141 family)
MILPRPICAAVAGILALAATAPQAQAQTAPAGCTGAPSSTWITVIVDGIRSSSGLVAATLYADESRRFLVKNGSLQVGRVKAVAGTTRVCITVPRPGTYALAIYHDENGNEKFDRNGIGFPAEGYGFSNNPSTIAGLPAFRSVRIAIPRAGLAARVHLKYP